MARQKEKYGKKPLHRVERIHSDELEVMAKDMARSINGLVKITQSKVEARVTFVIRGNLETTSEVLKKVHEKLGDSVEVVLE